MAPSSASVSAPAALKRPPTIQTRTIRPMYGTSRATLAGTRKIPEPITEPTTTQKASTGPSTRGKRGRRVRRSSVDASSRDS